MSKEFGLFSGLAGTKRKREGDAPQRPLPPPGTTHRVTIEQNIPQEDEWKTVPFKPRKRRKADCFGCEYGMTNPDESQPALKALWKLFSENFGKEMTNENLAEMMHEFFVKEIRIPMIQQGHDCPDWPVEMIIEHMEVHILEPTVNVANSIRNMKEIESLLMKQIRMENKKTGESKVDLKVLKALLDVQKHSQTLYNAKCTRQFGYSDQFKLDDRRGTQNEK